MPYEIWKATLHSRFAQMLRNISWYSFIFWMWCRMPNAYGLSFCLFLNITISYTRVCLYVLSFLCGMIFFTCSFHQYSAYMRYHRNSFTASPDMCFIYIYLNIHFWYAFGNTQRCNKALNCARGFRFSWSSKSIAGVSLRLVSNPAGLNLILSIQLFIRKN